MNTYILHKYECLCDTITPVGVYMTLRDKFADCKMLESAEYGNAHQSKSIVCFNSLSSFIVSDSKLTIINGDEVIEKNNLENVAVLLNDFLIEIKNKVHNPNNYNTAALIGYIGYNSIQYFDTIKLNTKKIDSLDIPDIFFEFYEFCLVFDHFSNKLSVYHFASENAKFDIEKIVEIINRVNSPTGIFMRLDEEKQANKAEDFLKDVKLLKEYCKIGDVFQVVLSRKFSQNYIGDDFLVYRNLRHINPSPYMFYFDYGNFKLFGSSPESHLSVKGKSVTINPIAGTIKRTGVEVEDKVRLEKLVIDPKENAEHDMLIDLARNDLSVYCKNVTLTRKKEVQQFSHVFHLVSEVTGEFKSDASIVDIIAKTFPAGTLSGGPKYKAMELIDKMETHQRNFYGGAIGFIDLQNNVNLAIMIRTICAKNNQLNYMAGAGITINSIPENELLEVNNKLNALRKAIELTNQPLN